MPNYRNNPNYSRNIGRNTPSAITQQSNPTSCPVPPRFQYDSLNDMPLAMAYVPFQEWEKPYALSKALEAGTIFPKLNKPFVGRGRHR